MTIITIITHIVLIIVFTVIIVSGALGAQPGEFWPRHPAGADVRAPRRVRGAGARLGAGARSPLAGAGGHRPVPEDTSLFEDLPVPGRLSPVPVGSGQPKICNSGGAPRRGDVLENSLGLGGVIFQNRIRLQFVSPGARNRDVDIKEPDRTYNLTRRHEISSNSIRKIMNFRATVLSTPDPMDLPK